MVLFIKYRFYTIIIILLTISLSKIINGKPITTNTSEKYSIVNSNRPLRLWELRTFLWMGFVAILFLIGMTMYTHVCCRDCNNPPSHHVQYDNELFFDPLAQQPEAISKSTSFKESTLTNEQIKHSSTSSSTCTDSSSTFGTSNVTNNTVTSQAN